MGTSRWVEIVSHSLFRCWLGLSFVTLFASCVAAPVFAQALTDPPTDVLRAACRAIDITPSLEEERPVWLAGYGWGRRATSIHDRLYARCVVLSDGSRRIALVSVDLIGLQYPEVLKIRERLRDFHYVAVSSTHNHEGPDTIGLWGKTPFQRGVDPEYLDLVVDRVVTCVREAANQLQPVIADFGMAEDESLLGDSRLPIVKDGCLRAIRFRSAAEPARAIGIVVQWNCHPEAMGSQNTQITADFPATAVEDLERHYEVPVVYFSGAVGGLMGPPDGRFHDAAGRDLKEGEFEFAAACGRAVGQLAQRAIANATELSLVPLEVKSSPVALPLENAVYRAARLAGVLRRKAVPWDGDFHRVDAPLDAGKTTQFAVVTEVACLQLGKLRVFLLPGELYPELVYGRFQDPADPNVDYPDAPLEPTIQTLAGEDPWMLLGLANDEIGYIIPKRQWDRQPPYAYGRTNSQYGEINSCGPEVAPILMRALAERVAELPDRRP